MTTGKSTDAFPFRTPNRPAARASAAARAERSTRLGRHAAGDEAVAAEQVALDQGDAGAESGRAGGRDQPGGPTADD